MRFRASYADTEALQLRAALLLYGGGSGISFASVHEPLKDRAGAPYLDAGRPVTLDFLRTLARGLGMGMRPEILPPQVLARTPELTAWWVPAAIRPMFFAQTCDGKTLDGKLYPHPPLVFAVERSRNLAVRALLENVRPGRNTAVTIAPYWNTSTDGSVCLGSMPATESSALDTLDAWVDGFFRSEFTHPNAAKLTTHPEGHLGLWRDLAGKGRFPPEWLAPAGTLEAWLCRPR
jgi:PRTRC genetic system protein B